jgi:hypothetical protein
MGLGDLIEKITTYTGIKWIVKKIWVDDRDWETIPLFFQ